VIALNILGLGVVCSSVGLVVDDAVFVVDAVLVGFVLVRGGFRFVVCCNEVLVDLLVLGLVDQLVFALFIFTFLAVLAIGVVNH